MYNVKSIMGILIASIVFIFQGCGNKNNTDINSNIQTAYSDTSLLMGATTDTDDTEFYSHIQLPDSLDTNAKVALFNSLKNATETDDDTTWRKLIFVLSHCDTNGTSEMLMNRFARASRQERGAYLQIIAAIRSPIVLEQLLKFCLDRRICDGATGEGLWGTITSYDATVLEPVVRNRWNKPMNREERFDLINLIQLMGLKSYIVDFKKLQCSTSDTALLFQINEALSNLGDTTMLQHSQQ